ncbi:Uncharacterized protein LW94_12349 [Fusarium fujikuroi]|nr:Uncharacterized protein LW94_12349 [Fusarium fujikuroi]
MGVTTGEAYTRDGCEQKRGLCMIRRGADADKCNRFGRRRRQKGSHKINTKTNHQEHDCFGMWLIPGSPKNLASCRSHNEASRRCTYVIAIPKPILPYCCITVNTNSAWLRIIINNLSIRYLEVTLRYLQVITDFSRPFLNAPDFLVVGDPMHFGAHNREKHLTSSLRRNLRTVGQSTRPGLSIGQRRFAMLALQGLLSVFTAMPQLLMVRGGLRCVLCWCNRRKGSGDSKGFTEGRDCCLMWYLFIQLPDNGVASSYYRQLALPGKLFSVLAFVVNQMSSPLVISLKSLRRPVKRWMSRPDQKRPATMKKDSRIRIGCLVSIVTDPSGEANPTRTQASQRHCVSTKSRAPEPGPDPVDPETHPKVAAKPPRYQAST